MNLTCIICSDGIIANSETYTTQCGHLFHYPCLIQWIERSKTCPQCRNRATEKTIHRVYFNLSNSESNGDDISTVQNKLDNLQFQFMLKEKDVKVFKQKYEKVKSQNATLREEIMELENKVRAHDSVMHALKDQITFFKSKAKERDKLADELSKLKVKLKQVESAELVVKGSREETTELLRNENDVDSLVILVATLKKALLDAEKKKGNVEHKVTQLQYDITKYRKELSYLESSNKELRQRVEFLSKRKSRERDSLSDKLHAHSIPVSDPDQLPTEIKNKSRERDHLSDKLRCDFIPVLDQSSTEDCSFSVLSPSNAHKIADTSHLKKRSVADNELCVKKSQAFTQAPAGVKQVSIFKRPTTHLDQMKTCKIDHLVYTGLGGQGKEDIYPSPQSTNTGIKRHRFDGGFSSSKLRKVSSVPPGRKLNKS